MRYSRNIFESENYRGAGVRTISAETIVASILTVLSALGVVFIIANFDEIMAMIAIWMADFLTSVFPILILAVAIICFMVITNGVPEDVFWEMVRRT